ncbi:MAG: hypothetical protein ACYCSW_10750 [bacterium]
MTPWPVFAAGNCPAGEAYQATNSKSGVCVPAQTGNSVNSNMATKEKNEFSYIENHWKPNGISTIPEDIWGQTGISGLGGALAPIMESLGFALLMFSFIFNMYKNLEKYTTGLESQAQPYFKLFYSFIFSAVFIYVWSFNQGGSGNLFYEYLLVINNFYSYIAGNLMPKAIIEGIIHNLHHTTTVINNSTGGSVWNPLTWLKAIKGYLVQSVFELIISIALGILYFFYLIVIYLTYLVQLLFLGTLYATFPIVLAVNYGEYAKDMKILANWVKWFIEVSLWGGYL